MVPSSILCRAQQDIHLRRAADTTLENVRLISTSAANAWAKEALAAESREARQLRNHGVADTAVAVKSARALGDDAVLSENPDRSFAHP